MCYEGALKTQRTRQQGLPERSESQRRSTIRSLKKTPTSFSGEQQTAEGHHISGNRYAKAQRPMREWRVLGKKTTATQ